MKFEVFKDNKRMFVTESDKCIPDKITQKMIINAGYRIKIDGKAVRKPQ